MANQILTKKISENYKTLQVLGQGCFGQVIECLKWDTKETVAVKVLKSRHSKSSSIREVQILEKLRCLDPDKYNIVKCHEWFHRIDRFFIVFEMLDMSLYDYMVKTKSAPMPLNGLRTIIKDLATALNALKGIGLIHSDLKMDNIMLVDHQRQPFRVKLIDFGLGLHKSEARCGLGVQALWYRSPEVILGLRFSEAIDIWSLGIIMAEMLLGFLLFPGRSEYDVLRFIIDLLGELPKRLLHDGMNTELFYNGHCKYCLYMQWTFKKPWEYHMETGIEPRDTRKHRLTSLDQLKTLNLQQQNSAEAADRSACVELLKEMLLMEPRDRITPSQILAHPFITTSNSSQNETVVAETTVSNTKDIAETTDDDRCSIKLPPGVIMVQPAEKTTETETSQQSTAFNPQAEQNKMADSPKTKDNSDLILESISNELTHDSYLVLESITDSVKISSDEEHDISSLCVEAPDSLLNQEYSLHTSEISEPKKKKKKKGIRRFFSSLKRMFFSCFHVPEDEDD